MRLEITTRNYTMRGNFKDILEKKIHKLDKYFPNDDAEAKVVLSTNGKSCRMEITVSSNGRQFRTEVDGNTMYYAIDDALPKLERQILKHKGKLTDKAGAAAPEFGEFAFVTGVEEEKTPEIVKTKKCEIYAIDVKDAVEELEMVGHDFYVFVNRATDNVEIVYRRHDGKIGLLQPYVKE